LLNFSHSSFPPSLPSPNKYQYHFIHRWIELKCSNNDPINKTVSPNPNTKKPTNWPKLPQLFGNFPAPLLHFHLHLHLPNPLLSLALQLPLTPPQPVQQARLSPHPIKKDLPSLQLQLAPFPLPLPPQISQMNSTNLTFVFHYWTTWGITPMRIPSTLWIAMSARKSRAS
jgi:hypothetical protein